MNNIEKEIERLLREPDVSGMDWELGQSKIALWKAALPQQILFLIEQARQDEREKMVGEIKGIGWVGTDSNPNTVAILINNRQWQELKRKWGIGRRKRIVTPLVPRGRKKTVKPFSVGSGGDS